MDRIAIDVTDLPNNAARRGHMVTLIGEGITVDELSHHFGTIGYEGLTSLGRRSARTRPSKGGERRRVRRPRWRRAGLVKAFWNRSLSCKLRSTCRGAG